VRDNRAGLEGNRDAGLILFAALCADAAHRFYTA